MKLILIAGVAALLCTLSAAEVTPIRKAMQINLQDLEQFHCRYEAHSNYEVCLEQIDDCIKRRVFRYGTVLKPSSKRVVRAYRICKADF